MTEQPLFTLDWQPDEASSADVVDSSYISSSAPHAPQSTPSSHSIMQSPCSASPLVSPALTHPPNDHHLNELVPRGYQIELYERACRENIIAYVETGSGKTLVAALLIKKILTDLDALPPLHNDQNVDPSNNQHVNIPTPPKLPGPFEKSLQPAAPNQKIAVFLVHRVPLVPQQAKVIKEVLQSDGCVGMYYGEKNVDNWSSSKWARNLCTKKVLVMTAQIFLNLLRHGFIDMRNVAILILDEVHHATKSHPYRRLFLEFYHTIPKHESRPHVFGMTATPVKAKASAKSEQPCLKAFAALEATLDATVVTVSPESQSEVEVMVPKPEEFIITYQSKSTVEDTELETRDEFEASESAAEVIALMAASEANGESAKLPSHVQEGVLHFAEINLVRNLKKRLGLQAAIYFARQLCFLNKINAEQTVAKLVAESIESERKSGGLPSNVLSLLDVLFSEYRRSRSSSSSHSSSNHKNRNELFRCIVFVQERISALTLAWLINHVFGQLNCTELSARSIVGAQSAESHVRMSQSKQNSIIKDFRDGNFGILVATNVVEEGLDVPACRLVVAFDSVMSPTAYVQGRGRARKRGARYIVFLEEDSLQHYLALYYAREGAKLMKDVANGEGCPEAERELCRKKLFEESVMTERKLYSRTTRARVGATEAVNLLHRYCFMKSAELGDIPFQKPCYLPKESPEGCTAIVTMHPRIPIDSGICSVPQCNPAIAKRYAALDAYTKLYQIGEVDEYLLPKRPARSKRVLHVIKPRSDLGVRIQVQRREQKAHSEMQPKASKKDKRLRVCRIAHPGPLQVKLADVPSENLEPSLNPINGAGNDYGGLEKFESRRITIAEKASCSSLFMYSIRLDHDVKSSSWYRPEDDGTFGLLLREKVLIEDLSAIRCPFGQDLLTLSYEGSIPWTESYQKTGYKYCRYMQLCLRGRCPGSIAAQEIEQREYGSSISTGFLLLPLMKIYDSGSPIAYDIDWGSIQQLLSLDWRSGNRAIAQELQRALVCSDHENCERVYLSSELDEQIKAKSSSRGYLNTAYRSFKQYFAEKHSTPLEDENQSMLATCNPLDMFSRTSVSTFMLPPETCRLIPLSPMACYIASVLPTWQTFLALRNCWRRNRIESNPIEFLAFARALQPNVNNVSKGCVDLSYERLEFLGDAVLKVINSMVSFVQTPEESEGRLSDSRDREVCNKNLADYAIESKIQDCVAFSGVSQKAKAWPWFWGAQQNKCVEISEKVLADCVESIIGVQYLHGGIELATEFLDLLTLTKGACEVLGIVKGGKKRENGRINVHLPVMGTGDKRYESAFVKEVEEIIGYQFVNKNHLVVALTHGSYLNGRITSYQRYEYLGDAIVGFLLLSHFFDKYPKLSPGELTSLRGPALSNDLFARVIVSWGIHKRFWFECPPLVTEIRKFEELVANEDDEEDVCKTITVPKVLGDLLESIIGAVVVDKGMRFDGVKEIVLRLMESELERFANPDKFKHNPVSEMVRMVQKLYNTHPTYHYLDGARDVVKICSIEVDKREIGRGTGPTRRVAKHKAAIEGLKVLGEEEGNGDGEREELPCETSK